MFPALLLCAVVCSFIFLVVRMHKVPVFKDAPVYSRSLPIIGVTHLFLTDSIKFWETLKKLTKDAAEQGGVIRAQTGLRTCYVITDPKDALTVANACLEKHNVYKFAECWLGQSLLTAPVPIWKRHRRLLGPAFSKQVIHGFMKVFNEQAKSLAEEMGAFNGKGPFKATSYIQNNSLRSSCLTTFGGNNLHDDDIFGKYLYALSELSHMINQRVRKFWQYSDLLYVLFGKQKKQDMLIKDLTNFSEGILQKAQATMQQSLNSKYDDRLVDFRTFLDIYLKMNSNNVLTNKELREELELTIAAAFDTTAVQLENILIYIGSHPEIQERVFQEIIREIGQEKDVVKEDLQKLVYTDAVIKEILRVAPVAPIIGRNIDKDVKLKNCTLRAGSHAIITLYGINRDSSWGPDANQFRPERWLEPGGVPNISKSFATFSIGKRGCVGKTFAMISMKISLVHILQNYKIKADHTKLKWKIDILLKPVSGQDISLNSRNIL